MANISLQLYSIKEEAEESFEKALELTAKCGYTGVEFAGYFGLNADQMNDLLKKYNLNAVSTHVGINKLMDSLDDEIAFAKALNYRMIVCPWLPCKTEEDTVKDAKFLEECAQKAKKEGIVIGYHNHAQEFVKFNGKYAMDIILENAPSIKFEPDVFWVAYAGVDPVSYITPLEQAGRICAIHAKELAKAGKDNVYVGEGKIDFKGIAAVCPPSKYPWIIEQEEYHSDHEDGITKSFKGLKAVLG
ncbi:MAG: sugar phosphate isomerase/epimerase [Treponema sp.]|jgi:sugar phosphate isomerase/epimerase|nr:sugar phosphate isomerase/epimerase [Treponema sp.]